MNKACKISVAVLALVGFLFMFPLLVTLTNSFMSEGEIGVRYSTSLSDFDIIDGIETRFVTFPLIPRQFSTEQYRTVLLEQPMFLMLMLNSLRLTLPVVLGGLCIALLGAYGFTVWQWKHKEILFYVYIVVMLMPLQAVLVPNFIVADWLGISRSPLAIILPGIFAPFGTFLLRQCMKAIPDACFEAARIDGAGELAIFLHIVTPQMKSGIAALSMLVFIDYWNVVEQAVIFIRDFTQEPLSIFLSRLAGGQVGLIFAASAVYLIIPFMWLIFGQEHLEKGIELSGVK